MLSGVYHRTSLSLSNFGIFVPEDSVSPSLAPHFCRQVEARKLHFAFEARMSR
jgi:hypothetical protein